MVEVNRGVAPLAQAFAKYHPEVTQRTTDDTLRVLEKRINPFSLAYLLVRWIMYLDALHTHETTSYLFSAPPILGPCCIRYSAR